MTLYVEKSKLVPITSFYAMPICDPEDERKISIIRITIYFYFIEVFYYD